MTEPTFSKEQLEDLIENPNTHAAEGGPRDRIRSLARFALGLMEENERLSKLVEKVHHLVEPPEIDSHEQSVTLQVVSDLTKPPSVTVGPDGETRIGGLTEGEWMLEGFYREPKP